MHNLSLFLLSTDYIFTRIWTGIIIIKRDNAAQRGYLTQSVPLYIHNFKANTSQKNIKAPFRNNFGAMHIIYQINRLATTKIDSTYSN